MWFKKNFPTSIQIDTKDCGPACLQIICKYYSRFFDIEYLREITGARKEGTSVFDLVKASEKLNIKSLVVRTSYKKLHNEIPLPSIVYWQGNHFIVVYKVAKNHVYVSDPAVGLVKYTKKEFTKGWLGYIKEKDSWRKGVCIALEITTEFKEVVSEANKKPNFLDSARYIWSFISPYKKNVFQIITVLLALTFINSLFPIITQAVIDVGISTQNVSFITLMLIGSIVLAISSSIGTWVQQSINMHFSLRIKMSMVSDFLVRLFKLPLNFFESRLMGDLFQRSYDFDRIESLIMGASFNAILGILYMLVFGTILFLYNSTLFYIYFALSILYVLWVLLFWSIRKRMDIKYFSYLSYNHSLWMEILSKILDIKCYDYGRDKRWQWEKVQINLFKTRIKLLHVSQLQMVGEKLINTIKDVLLVYCAALYVMEGSMTLGMLIAVQYIVGQLNNPTKNIVDFIVAFQMAYISFTRVTEINKVKTEENKDSLPSALVNFEGGIRFENVSFKYSTNEDPVLKGLSFTIPNGKITAVVGESGSGKSTIIKLLMQLYTPLFGGIFIGQSNFNSFSINDWRTQCGVITQESSIFKDSILNNIMVGRIFDRERFKVAIEIANIENEISSLPMGFNTMLGENGRGLSEGQKQRVLFARAVYDDPNFLFLDELTSSLDSGNENSILQSIKEKLPGKTIVLAAHRLSSIIKVDSIVVLKNGRVVEIGDHVSLCLNKGEYYNLFKSQMQC